MSDGETMREMAWRLAEENPYVAVEWDEEAQRKYREWWDSLTPEEQEHHRDGMIAT